MKDIRFYNLGSKNDSVIIASEETTFSKASDAYAIDLEVFGNKVSKFLLTYKGTDCLDPEYGGVALHYEQISPKFIPKLTIELIEDINRCKNYIRKSELGLPERIVDIALVNIRYIPEISPDRLDVFIEIVTSANRKALVAVNKKL